MTLEKTTGSLERQTTWPSGGIGRHARLKIVCRKACGFESHLGYLYHANMGELVDPPVLEIGAEICVSVRVRLSVQILGVINPRLKGSKPSISHSVEGTMALGSKDRVGAVG